jgi:ATP/maltotriose-dependent transcriptional regulator MalT
MSAGQHPTFIRTKVLLPRSAPALIDRPRLLALLGQVKEKQLVVIKAGTGFGKISLARQYGIAITRSWLIISLERCRLS